ncbi:PqqD family protein [uncultured Bacteroides sp.]|uniref:PqqD family protein n=1 Tax=uncultured Bacteroides sp. TaxID=162156 RepID=UPI002638DFDD|nr:PqqD family protein [uncultured Bacteroides sp.]
MKTKKEFTLHQIGDEHIIMHNGIGNVDFNHIISLNPTAARLWKSVEGKEFDAETLTTYLTEHYEVEADTASRDALRLIEEWQKVGIIE